VTTKDHSLATVSILAQMAWTMKSTGSLKDERESFMLDGGAPF